MTPRLVFSALSNYRRYILGSVAVASVAMVACRNDITGPGVTEPTTPQAQILSTVLCTAAPRAGTLRCETTPDPLGTVLPSYMLGVDLTSSAPKEAIVIGSQNVNVKLTSSNIVVDSINKNFSFDVNVKSLR